MQENKTLNELKITTDKILIKTKEYISNFDRDTTLSFVVDDPTFKTISLNYRKFTTEILHIVDITDALGSQLASLTLSADKNQNAKRAAYMSNHFERYCAWRDSFLKFLSVSDRLFSKKDNFKYSLALNEARIFFSLTENFNKSLND